MSPWAVSFRRIVAEEPASRCWISFSWSPVTIQPSPPPAVCQADPGCNQGPLLGTILHALKNSAWLSVQIPPFQRARFPGISARPSQFSDNPATRPACSSADPETGQGWSQNGQDGQNDFHGFFIAPAQDCRQTRFSGSLDGSLSPCP